MGQWQFKADKEKESEGFPLLPPGQYRLQIADIYKEGTSEKNGYPYVVLATNVVGGDYDGARGPLHTVVQVPEDQPGHGILVHFLHALGLAHDGDITLETEDFIGLEFDAEINEETYPKNDGSEGTRNRITKLFVPETQEEQPAQEPKPAPQRAAPNPVQKKAAAVAAAKKGTATKTATKTRRF